MLHEYESHRHPYRVNYEGIKGDGKCLDKEIGKYLDKEIRKPIVECVIVNSLTLYASWQNYVTVNLIITYITTL